MESERLAAPRQVVEVCAFLDCSSLWIPSYSAPSAWIEHAPFAAWLVGQLRPATLVELGVHLGYSYFAFCESVQRHGLQTKCFGVDTWLGDEHAGFYGEEVYGKVNAQNARYAGFSSLMRLRFNDAVASFDDGSIDLLHIDGRHFYEDVQHDFETWRPKLSDRAVVLMHDTAERGAGFGVYRLMADLADEFPTFEFTHGHGLGVVAVGAAAHQALSGLFESPADTVREAYEGLGGVVAARVELKTLRAGRQEIVGAYESSASWRLTAPCRALARTARAARRRVRQS